MKSVFKSFVLFVLAFFCINSNVFADSASGFGYATPGNGGGSGNCLSQWGGCWPGPVAAYRLTLVDLTGKKIEGTKSVDFSSNEFYHCSDNGIELPCAFRAYGPISGYYDTNGKFVARYGYKYSEHYSDYSIASDSDEFYMYFDSKGNFKNQYTVERFLHGEFTNLTSDDWEYNGKKMSFYDMFLHYCGLLPDEYDSYIKADARVKQIVSNSTIIFEPAYPVYYYSNGTIVYRYGTVTELAQTMLKKPGYGLDWGISGALRQNVGLCVGRNDKQKLSRFNPVDINGNKIETIGTDVCSNNGFNNIVSLNDLINPQRTFGMALGVLDINGGLLCVPCTAGCPCPGDNPTNTHMNLSLCDDESSTIDFSISTVPSTKQLHQNRFKVNDNVDDNQNIWCFDSVQYHFNDTLSDMSGTHNKFIFVNPRPGVLNVERTCLYGENYSLNQQKDIESYKNTGIEIGFYGNKYNIYPSDSATNSSFQINDKTVKPKEFHNENVDIKEQSVSDVIVDGNKYKLAKYTFDLYYVIPNNYLFIGNGSDLEKVCGDGSNETDACISLVDLDNSFGYSNKVAKPLTHDLQENRSCKTTYKIDYDAKTNINFRVISLQNPFPARDGTSRLPAENWLSTTENNVYNYITTNRGVVNGDPESMYTSKEPMYTVTLTPSTMLKIREYNKQYSYYSMYELGEYSAKVELSKKDKNADKLKCNSEGRECYSEFLRDNKYIPQDEGQNAISGVCFFGRGTMDETLIRNEYNRLFSNQRWFKQAAEGYLETISQNTDTNMATAYALTYGADLNNNGRLDSEDIEIMLAYSKSYNFNSDDEFNALVKNALENGDIVNWDEIMYKSYRPNAYYVCAQKTYKSGGPVKEDE